MEREAWGVRRDLPCLRIHWQLTTDNCSPAPRPLPTAGNWVRFPGSISHLFVLSHNMPMINTTRKLASFCRFSNTVGSLPSDSLAAVLPPPPPPPPPPPHQRVQAGHRPFPAGYCHPPTAELPKIERDPISTSGPSIVSMSSKFSMLPNQAISSDKSIRFSPLAAARPLTTLSWPEALNARGSRRAGRMAIGRSACSLAVARATEAGLGSNGRSGH